MRGWLSTLLCNFNFYRNWKSFFTRRFNKFFNLQQLIYLSDNYFYWISTGYINEIQYAFYVIVLTYNELFARAFVFNQYYKFFHLTFCCSDKKTNYENWGVGHWILTTQLFHKSVLVTICLLSFISNFTTLNMWFLANHTLWTLKEDTDIVIYR